MPNWTQHKDATDTTRGPSPIIWADFPTIKGIYEGGDIIHHYDDFIDFIPTASQVKYRISVDTGGTITFVAGEAGATGQATAVGNVECDGDGTAQDGLVLAWPLESDLSQGPLRANGSSDLCCFEARIKVDSVANQGQGFFIGLIEGSADLTADLTLTDTDHLLDLDKSFIGFHTLPGDGDALLPVYQEGGAAVSDGTSQAIAANTWMKLGFQVKRNVCEWRINGALVRTVTISSAINWPDGDRLVMGLATKVGTGAAAVETHPDWWRCGWYAK